MKPSVYRFGTRWYVEEWNPNVEVRRFQTWVEALTYANMLAAEDIA